MKTPSPKKQKKTGTPTPLQKFRMARRASQLWYTPEQYDLIKRAAALDRRPMTTFAIRAVVEAAKKTLNELHDLTVDLMNTKGIRRGKQK